MERMRYRLRSLFIFVTVAALLAAIAGYVLDVYRPVAIWRSAEGKRAIGQLSAAKRVAVEMYSEGTKLECELSLDSRKALLAWLKRAIRDTRPAKRIALGNIRFESANDTSWTVLEMNRDELSVQTRDGTWRGLNRAEFEEFVRKSIAKDDS
jgi:hypothetical protein